MKINLRTNGKKKHEKEDTWSIFVFIIKRLLICVRQNEIMRITLIQKLIQLMMTYRELPQGQGFYFACELNSLGNY